MVLFIVFCRVVLILQSVDEILKYEQYFPVVLFIMLYKVVVRFESVDEILKCDDLYESY